MRVFDLAPPVLVALLLALAVPQTTPPADIDNPSAVSFFASSDHAALDGYELDILKADGTVAKSAINLGKPTPAVTSQLCLAPLSVQALPFASGYTVRIRAKAGTAYSTYTVSVNKFNRVPGPPTGATLATNLTIGTLTIGPNSGLDPGLVQFQLATTSPYYGQNKGADMEAIARATCGVREGRPCNADGTLR
jgi:hypothetical protein